ncbi:MAG: BtpA/SgcQ family protein [Candidatus Eisenbacteria bacterium]
MTSHLTDMFGAGKIGIGVIHLPALPGSPDFGGSLTPVVERAVAEAALLQKAGFDGVIIENYGDLPFFKAKVGPETVAAMTVAVSEVRRVVEIPVGVNVLRNDHEAALAIAAACGCEFIRVNILVGAFVTPEGIIEGEPARVLRERRRVAPETLIFADVMVKHANPLAATTIVDDALDAAERGKADCLIVTGPRTGSPPTGEDLKAVGAGLEEADLRIPVMVGSGITLSNAGALLKLSDGVIVGSYIRKHGRAGEEIVFERAIEIGSIKKEGTG